MVGTNADSFILRNNLSPDGLWARPALKKRHKESDLVFAGRPTPLGLLTLIKLNWILLILHNIAVSRLYSSIMGFHFGASVI